MSEHATPAIVHCADLDAALAFYVDDLGFRLDMIMPADAPHTALVSGHGVAVRLVTEQAQAKPPEPLAFAIARAAGKTSWVMGRAGMQYRDLIPGRLGGRFIASHIRITEGGPVADYVHHHKIRFQTIYCRKGWVRVVYEDQGQPFVMHEGDCVLQPPGIRHRVLESSPGLEVIEIADPAEHETWRDHALALPNAGLMNPRRAFEGQRFVHHEAAHAPWTRSGGIAVRDTGIAEATGGIADVRVLRLDGKTTPRMQTNDLLFLAILKGRVRLTSATLGRHTLEPDDACAVPKGANYALEAETPCEVLEVALR